MTCNMEKAILKTLIYAGIFDYPLKVYEIHKWLAGKKAFLRQVEKALVDLNQKGKVKSKKGYFFLPGKEGSVRQRHIREKQSYKFLLKAKLITWFLKIIPWIKLIGISGGVAVENAQKKDDIDLFIVTSKNRLWTVRLLVLGFFSMIGQRRKAGQNGRKIAGKLCLNMLLEEDRLGQTKKDIYLAHEVLQMKVLWQRDGMYFKYLMDNEWVFKFLPNWINGEIYSMQYKVYSKKSPHTKYSILHTVGDRIENLARKFQLNIMGQPKGLERIEDGAVYFHPEDCRLKVLLEYAQRLKKFGTS